MAREAKTNAMRMLDRKKIKYEVLSYECDEFIDGMHMAEVTGAPVESSFKTLLTQGKSGSYYVVVIPIAEEIDLKKAAKQMNEKSIAMVPVRSLLGITGYVRGGCSPIGMKKQFPTYIDSSAEGFEEIYVSGGRVGLSLKLKTEELLKACGGRLSDLIAKKQD